jgi:pyridinium-3,5-biscarboxylic acid mononucleotide sulfurtransferase
MTEPLQRLIARLCDEDRLITAFSGGADSALLAAVAHDVLGECALAVTAVSASLPDRERAAARQFAQARGMRHVEVCTDELEREEYIRNDGDRCFHCKSALFDALTPLANLSGASIALGTNVDDLRDYRPGQRAARDRGALFPLLDARLTKADVRAISRSLGLVTADKPAAACLSSRIAYGDRVTAELLQRVERAEDAVQRAGFAESRVRTHANGTVARIEVPEGRLSDLLSRRAEITDLVRATGFVFVALDLGGLRSGGMNSLLQLGPTRRAG